jgi:hypothetical protein
MNYSLGNMLSGNNGSLNPDKLSLDLQFATDKTLTARKGPTPTFTRASAATEVGSDGLIRYAPENLALQSENFGTTWTNNTGNALALNDALSPTGTLTADRIDFPATATTGLLKNIQQSFGSLYAGSGPLTASVWLRTVSGTSTVYLTLLDGVPFQRVHVACNVTTTWTRFSVTLNVPAGGLHILIGPDTRTTVGTPAQPAVQDAASVYAWGAQLERHTSARDYIPTTTAAVFGARFDHDPVTLACKGFLIEESRTNLTTYSEDMSAANGWSEDSGGVAWVNDATSSPTGNTTAEKLEEGILPLSNRHITVKSVTVVTGTSYTVSVFAKASERSILQIATATGFTLGYRNFDLTNGTVGSGDLGNPIITEAGNGWYRCSVTAVSNLTGNAIFTFGIVPLITSGRFASYVAVMGNGLFLWGAQVEAGSFPTSYIPTTTASVVRSADLCSITGAAFTGFYNPLAGTAVVRSSFRQNNAGRPFSFNNNALTNVFEAFNGFQLSSFIASGGVTQYQQSPNITMLEINTFALAAEASSAMAATNGTLAIAGTGIMPVGIDRLNIGNRADGARNINGHISFIKYFKKRLSNAKLTQLTT